MTIYYGTEATVTLVPMTCPADGCGVVYALSEWYQRERRKDGNSWHCPNGHSLSYRNAIKSDTERLREAETRETALRDQLRAAACEAEKIRGVLLRDRHRFANGVCPCCNRSFENVARHMTTKHPDYDVTKVQQAATTMFPCGCGRSFTTLPGLRRHQSAQRYGDWYKPNTSAWSAHLTKV